MANLKALRQKVKNITDYSPELAQFNNQLDELLNDAYYCIWTMKRWNFSTKLSTMRLHTDITATTDTENNGGNNVTLSVNKGERKVTFVANMDRLHDPDIWEGQPIEIDNMEYTISKVIDLKTLLLVSPFEGTTTTTNIKWKIKKRWYDLPENCLELLYLGHRDYPYVSVSGSQNPYGKSTAILPRREEDVDLRVDYTQSYAEAYITSPTKHIAPAEQLVIDEEATGLFQGNTYYEFAWAFLKDGKVGALSEPLIFKVREDNKKMRLIFQGWDDLRIVADTVNDKDQQPTQWEGFRKVICWNKNFDRNTGERKGLPCWLYVINGGDNRNESSYLEKVVVEDVNSFYDIVYPNQLDNGSERYIEIDGNHQQIRPYPRPVGFDFEVEQKRVGETITVFHDYVREMVMRYMIKPKDMLLSTDVPQMPYEFHQLIVYKALEDIYLKLGQQGLASTYERKYMKEINNLAKRYVDKIDQRVVRGRFQIAHGRPTYDGTSLRRLT
tara:strand:+ start:7157 stop:8650 length:1494 start_codon:yes stop_codon:yes gene_type:complete